MTEPAPLILTLKLDDVSFERFNALRQQHFPAERNFLPAHVTLFHALPAEQEAAILPMLSFLCQKTAVLPLAFPKLRFLGNGVAVEVECPELLQLRQVLAEAWHPWLTKQDRHGFKPHITLQNKVTAEMARPLYESLQQEWDSPLGQGEGLLLWRYLGGPWESITECLFRS